jgi:hypothetical protein
VVSDYRAFLQAKGQNDAMSGFEPRYAPGFLFDFQHALVEWAVRMGRAAIFADCGLGKTPIELVWAQNVLQHTNGNVLIAAPLAVSQQIVREAEKFGVEVRRSSTGKAHRGITVTNYERLHLFNTADFVAFVGDESSILKNFDGVRRAAVTQFARVLPYRLLSTATAAPNDYIELGTSSEALGYLGYMDMLTRFFKADSGSIKASSFRRGEMGPDRAEAKWRFKGHAERAFWRWVCSWARAVRKPSDLGFDDGAFVLPALLEQEHIVEARTLASGMLFALPAADLREQREERRRTLTERCERLAALATTGEPAMVWCHLNPEGDLLERLISGGVQVSGKDSDEAKEEKLLAFADGKIRALVTKPQIGAWGLNCQHCAHVATFPSHSFEQFYQLVRRCYRFGQKRQVKVDIVASEGERGVLANMQRKARAAERMFTALVEQMNDSLRVDRSVRFTEKEMAPAWL